MRTKIQLNFCPMVNGKDITTLLNRKPFSTGGLNFPSAFLKGEKKKTSMFSQIHVFLFQRPHQQDRTGALHACFGSLSPLLMVLQFQHNKYILKKYLMCFRTCHIPSPI